MTIRSGLLALPLAVMGWLATLAAVGLLTDDAPAQVVFFPSAGFMGNLPEGAAILSSDPWSVTLASDEAHFVYKLYQSGARLVLPSGLQGCAAKTR